jgi:hypothetical protein
MPINDEPVSLTRLEDGTLFPEHIRVNAHRVGRSEPTMELVLDVVDGRVAFTRFGVERQRSTGPGSWPEGEAIGPEVTAGFLHDLNVGTIFDHVVRALAGFALEWSRWSALPEGEHPPPWATTDERTEAGDRALATRSYRNSVTVADLRRVASIVNANPRRQRKAVSEQLQLPERTASRWIATARSRGFLDKKESQP